MMIHKIKKPGAGGPGLLCNNEVRDGAENTENSLIAPGFVVERRKSDREKWTAKTFTRPDGKIILDYRLSRQNGLGEYVDAEGNGVAIGLICNVEQVPQIALDLLTAFYAAKGGAK